MKSKAPLALMEQMVMLLVFAFAAALCMQAFVKSDEISLKSSAKSNAALAAQNTAEAIRHSGGSLENALTGAADMLGGKYGDLASPEGLLSIDYDEDWNVTENSGRYFLTVKVLPSPAEGMQKVSVQVFSVTGAKGSSKQAGAGQGVAQPEDELLFELETAWMEVGAYE